MLPQIGSLQNSICNGYWGDKLVAADTERTRCMAILISGHDAEMAAASAEKIGPEDGECRISSLFGLLVLFWGPFQGTRFARRLVARTFA